MNAFFGVCVCVCVCVWGGGGGGGDIASIMSLQLLLINTVWKCRLI